MVSRIVAYIVAGLFGVVGGGVAASYLGPTSEALERTVAGALGGGLIGMFAGALAGELDERKDEQGRAAVCLLVGLIMGIIGATQTALIRSLLIQWGLR